MTPSSVSVPALWLDDLEQASVSHLDWLWQGYLAAGNVTLLTDGKARNTGGVFAHDDNRFAYSSTRRNGQDTDIWIMDATDPKTDHMLLQIEGGGWNVWAGRRTIRSSWCSRKSQPMKTISGWWMPPAEKRSC